MKDPRRIIFLVLGIVAALVVLRLTIFAPRPNDQRLIADALHQSIEASKEGRAGGVLDILSSKFRINDQSPGRMDIAKFIRDSHPDVDVSNTTAIVSGDTARIDSPVHVKAQFLTQTFDQQIPNVTFVFKREDAYRYFVIPTTEWHLTDIVVPGDVINIDTSQFGM
jgi:hypothetical protein